MGAPKGDLGGTSYTNPLVTGLYGFPIAPTPPQVNSVPTWNGSAYTPIIFPAGINQTTNDVICGPGSGTVPCVIPPGTVTNPKLAAVPAATLKGNPTASAAQPMDLSVGGTLAFAGGSLGLAPSGVVGQQVSISAPSAATLCFSIDAFGRTTNIAAGNCSGGVILTADDGLTQLTADDGLTILTAESSGGGGAGCTTNFVAKFNVNCNAIMAAVR
jgi:nicotinamide mononucleotide (NMN) deamidase PncC